MRRASKIAQWLLRGDLLCPTSGGREISAIMTGKEAELLTGDPDVLLFKYDMEKWDILFRPLLVDYCSFLSEILRLQPLSDDKCTKLLLGY